ncbi:MAG: hypothetical protein ACK57P_15620, partial [Planctomycetota bacterium]
MSQVASPVRPLSPDQPRGGVDATTLSRDSLAIYIEQAARNMRRTEFFYGLLWWLTVVLFVVTVAILVDHWLWPLTKLARFAVLGSLVGWSCWWLPRRVVPPMIHRIHIEHAARMIEKQYPECKDSLISWLQLSREDSKTPKGVVSYLGRYAVRNLNGQDSQSIADSATVVRLAAAFFGCLLCSAIYMFASPKSGLTSFARVLLPWANIAPAARVNILEVLPGSTTVTQGSVLPVTVTVRGMHLGEKVSLRFDLSDGQLVDQFLPMTPEIERINYKIDLGKTFGGIHQPLKYWVHAGDAVDGPYEVKVQVVPLVAVERTELQYPAYTKLKPRSLLQTGSFEAPEGTRIELFASANQAMKAARLEFDPVLERGIFQTARDLVNMEIVDQQIQGQWIATLDEKLTNPTVTSYRIHATNQLGESNADPVLYQVKVIADLPPEAAIGSDTPAVLEIPASGSLELELRGSDPDYGLTSLHVFGAPPEQLQLKTRTELFRDTVFESEEGVLGQVVRSWILQPSSYGWKPGQELDLVVEAYDNRHDPKSQLPKPNRSLSTPVRVRITEDRAPDGEDAAKPPPKPEPQQENKQPKPKTKWELTPDKKESPQSKGRDSKDQQKSSKSTQDARQDSNNGLGTSDSNPSDSQSREPSSQDQDQGQGQGTTQGENQGERKGQGKGQGRESDSDSNNDPGDAENPSGSQSPDGNSSGAKPKQENRKPPSHDGEAIERIEQFRQEQEARAEGANGQPKSDQTDMPQGAQDQQRPNPEDAGKEGAGKEGAGKEGAGKEGAGKEGAGKEGAGKEGAGKEGAGKEGAGKEGAGKEGAGKEGAGKEGAGKE